MADKKLDVGNVKVTSLVVENIDGNVQIIPQEEHLKPEVVVYGTRKKVRTICAENEDEILFIRGCSPGKDEKYLTISTATMQVGCDIQAGGNVVISGVVQNCSSACAGREDFGAEMVAEKVDCDSRKIKTTEVVIRIPKNADVEVRNVSGTVDIGDFHAKVEVFARLERNKVAIGRVRGANITSVSGAEVIIAGVTEWAVVVASYDGKIDIHSPEKIGKVRELTAFSDHNGKITYYGSAEIAVLAAFADGRIKYRGTVERLTAIASDSKNMDVGQAYNAVLIAGDGGWMEANEVIRTLIENKTEGGGISVAKRPRR